MKIITNSQSTMVDKSLSLTRCPEREVVAPPNVVQKKKPKKQYLSWQQNGVLKRGPRYPNIILPYNGRVTAAIWHKQVLCYLIL